MLETNLSFKTEINLYYDVFIPEGIKKPAPLLIAVHGYGAHKRYMMREAQSVAPPNFIIAAIQGPYQHFRKTDNGYRTGFGWLTDFNPEESIEIHQNFILSITEKLESEDLIDMNEIYLFGFSQACALNFRFAFTHSNLLRGIIGICGGVPSDLDTNEIYRPTSADIFYLYSTNDEFYPLEKYLRFKEKLKKYGNVFTANSYQAKHEITDSMREDVKNWLK